MDAAEINYIKKPQLKNTTLIEGLPGIGLVGKLATDHLLDELETSKFAELTSCHLPPQVTIQSDGTIKLVNMQFHYMQRQRGDLVLLSGDFQGITPESQYLISEKILSEMMPLNLNRIYTLGGLGTGSVTHNPRVFGAATRKDLVSEHERQGVIFKGGGAIFGASGLLLGLGERRSIDGVCLMGETHGQIIDAKSAEAVLKVLTQMLGLDVDMTALEQKAKETE
ncbi:MAG: proteasome assembly chaperone family protein, partial [Candidatus Altiarchaeales archaeon]|nr:proteasome assembly chaperone family protein [Candidatus Altiarchaeales archaeon]